MRIRLPVESTFRDLSTELEAVEPKIAKLTPEWEKAAEKVEKVSVNN